METEKVIMDVIAKIGVQVPALVVLVFLTRMFLQHMEHAQALLKELQAEHLEARKQSREAIDSVQKALVGFTEVVAELKVVVQEHVRKIR